jgi:hypothetical protein
VRSGQRKYLSADCGAAPPAAFRLPKTFAITGCSALSGLNELGRRNPGRRSVCPGLVWIAPTGRSFASSQTVGEWAWVNGRTTELTDAGDPPPPNWKLTWPARARSSDFVMCHSDALVKVSSVFRDVAGARGIPAVKGKGCRGRCPSGRNAN